MATFILEDRHLERLSPAARRELLQVLGEEFDEVRALYAEREWDPEGNESYPLTVEEACHMIRGMPDAAHHALRIFASNYDDAKRSGTATLRQLLDATGHTKYENVNRQLSWILLRLRSVTGDSDAWLVNWRARDWKWDEEKGTYARGKYFISGPGMEALREAFELEGEEDAPS